MEYRPLSVVACLIALLAAASTPNAIADEATDRLAQQAAWDQRLEAALQLQAKGQAEKADATALYEQQKLACFKKFRVTACQLDARTEYIQATNAARRIENEGKAQERQVKKEQLADKDARREAEAPQREADRALRLEQTSQAQEMGELERQRKESDLARKAVEGRAKRLENDRRIAEKQAAHERKQAEGRAKAEQKAAEQKK